MRALFVIILLAALVLPPIAFAEGQTFVATHTYIQGDHDSKDDARQRCLLEAKRKILDQAGVYIESASDVKNSDLSKERIISFAAPVMQVKDIKEEVGLENGHMSLTLTLKADVDLAEVQKQLAARQLDAGVGEDVTAQEERLKYLEAKFEMLRRQQQVGQAPEHAQAAPAIDISAESLETLYTQAVQGNPIAQLELGYRYDLEEGVPQDSVQARQWFEKAAAQGDARAQAALGLLYYIGWGVPHDYAKAKQWYEKAAAQDHAQAQYTLGRLYAKGGQGVPKDKVRAYMWYNLAAAHLTGAKQAAVDRDKVARHMTPAQIAEAQQLSKQCKAQQFKGC